jgi:hypothetical protein
MEALSAEQNEANNVAKFPLISAWLEGNFATLGAGLPGGSRKAR